MQMEPAPSLADRFARFIERLCAMIGVYAAVFPWAEPLVAAAQARVRRLGERFAVLCARAGAGRRRARRAVAQNPDAGRPRPSIVSPTMPWLMRAVGAAVHCAEPLNRLLDDPEMAELVAAAPQAARILRPLCRMLGVKRPAYLRTARRTGAPAAMPPERDSVQPGAASTAHPGSPTHGGMEVDAAQAPWPPPAAVRLTAEEEAAARARRPGGLYWDGTGFRWA